MLDVRHIWRTSSTQLSGWDKPHPGVAGTTTYGLDHPAVPARLECTKWLSAGRHVYAKHSRENSISALKTGLGMFATVFTANPAEHHSHKERVRQ